MEKLKMHSPNFVDQNIAQIAELFPNCVTESRNEKGDLQRAIDFDLLKQELSAISSHIFHFGTAGMGMRFKLMQNALSSIHLNAAAQASKLAEQAGIKPSRFYEAITVGHMASSSPITVSVLGDISTPPTFANFSVKMLEKDLRYAQEWTDELDIPFDLLDDTLQDFIDSTENPGKKSELSSVINMYRKFDTY